MARWAQARVIAVEVAADKHDACRKAGADEVVDPTPGSTWPRPLRDLTHGNGVDVVIDYVSATAVTLEAGVKALGRRGRLVILGGAAQPFHRSGPAYLLLHEQELLGSRYATARKSSHRLRPRPARQLRPLVTEFRPLEDAELVHERVERGEVDRPRRLASCLKQGIPSK